MHYLFLKIQLGINMEVIDIDFDITFEETCDSFCDSEFSRVRTKWKKLMIDVR